jgi:hypothetical protein
MAGQLTPLVSHALAVALGIVVGLGGVCVWCVAKARREGVS